MAKLTHQQVYDLLTKVSKVYSEMLRLLGHVKLRDKDAFLKVQKSALRLNDLQYQFHHTFQTLTPEQKKQVLEPTDKASKGFIEISSILIEQIWICGTHLNPEDPNNSEEVQKLVDKNAFIRVKTLLDSVDKISKKEVDFVSINAEIDSEIKFHQQFLETLKEKVSEFWRTQENTQQQHRKHYVTLGDRSKLNLMIEHEFEFEKGYSQESHGYRYSQWKELSEKANVEIAEKSILQAEIEPEQKERKPERELYRTIRKHSSPYVKERIEEAILKINAEGNAKKKREDYQEAFQILNSLKTHKGATEYLNDIHGYIQAIPLQYRVLQDLDDLQTRIQNSELPYELIHEFVTTEKYKKIFNDKKTGEVVRNDFNKLYYKTVAMTAATLAKKNRELYLAIDTKNLLVMDFAQEDNKAFTNNFNLVAKFIIEDILRHDSIEMRTRALEFWINVADYSIRQYGDFATAMAIKGALGNSAVTRLKATREGLSSYSKQKLLELEDILEGGKNFANQLQAYESYNHGPLVPYTGTFQSQITFFIEGNGNKFGGMKHDPDKGLSRVLKDPIGLDLAVFFEETQKRIQSAPEIEADNLFLQKKLNSFQPQYTEKTSYDRSLNLEPRETKISPASIVLSSEHWVGAASDITDLPEGNALKQDKINNLLARAKQFFDDRKHQILEEAFLAEDVNLNVIVELVKEIRALTGSLKKLNYSSQDNQHYSHLIILQDALERYQRVLWIDTKIKHLDEDSDNSDLPNVEVEISLRLNNTLDKLASKEEKILSLESEKNSMRYFQRNIFSKFIDVETDKLLGIDTQEVTKHKNNLFTEYFLDRTIEDLIPDLNFTERFKTFEGFKKVNSILEKNDKTILWHVIEDPDKANFFDKGLLRQKLTKWFVTSDKLNKDMQEHAQKIKALQQKLQHELSENQIIYYAYDDLTKKRFLEKRSDLLKDLEKQLQEVAKGQQKLNEIDAKLKEYADVSDNYFLEKKNLKKVLTFVRAIPKQIADAEEDLDHPDFSIKRERLNMLQALLTQSQNLLASIPIKTALTSEQLKIYNKNQSVIELSRKELQLIILQLSTAIENFNNELSHPREYPIVPLDEDPIANIESGETEVEPMLLRLESQQFAISASPNPEISQFLLEKTSKVDFEVEDMNDVLLDAYRSSKDPFSEKTKPSTLAESKALTELETETTKLSLKPVDFRPEIHTNKGNATPWEYNTFNDGTRQFVNRTLSKDPVRTKATAEAITRDVVTDPRYSGEYYISGKNKKMVEKSIIWLFADWYAKGAEGDGPKIYKKGNSGQWQRVRLYHILPKLLEIKDKAETLKKYPWEKGDVPEHSMSSPEYTP